MLPKLTFWYLLLLEPRELEFYKILFLFPSTSVLRSRLEQTSEDLEAAKLSLQDLLRENLWLRVALNGAQREAEQQAQADREANEKRVTNNNIPIKQYQEKLFL